LDWVVFGVLGRGLLPGFMDFSLGFYPLTLISTFAHLVVIEPI